MKRIVANGAVVSLTRKVHKTHLAYQRRGNSTRGRALRLTFHAEDAAFKLCGEAAENAAHWAELLAAAVVPSDEELRSLRRQWADDNRSLGWQWAEVERALSRFEVDPQISLETMDLESIAFDAAKAFRNEIDSSVSLPKAAKRVRRRNALEDLCRTLAALRLIGAAQRTPAMAAVLAGGCCRMLGASS